MPNKEMTDEDKYIYLYKQMKISESKAKTEKDRETIAANWQQTEDSFDGNTISNALQQMDERESNMSGGMIKYNMGGSMLNPPERQKYSMAGKVVKLIAEALNKTTKAGKKPSRAKVRQAVDDVKKENPNLEKEIADDIQEVKDLRYVENYSVGGGGKRDIDSMLTSLLRGDTENIARSSVPMKATKTYKKGQMKAGIAGSGAGTLLGGAGTLVVMSDSEEERINPEDYPTYKKDSDSAKSFREAQRKAKKEKKEFFEFEGREYNVTEAKNMGGMMKYNEGGSMLVPPEMEDEMPEDTYDNIPEDEMEAAEASQLPDDEMEDGYLEFVLNESLETDDQEYLMSVLETDERLSSIFDKVMDVAGEFSGEGEVDGPGTGVSDSIPARLSDGEFVFTKKATDQMGADQLQTMMDEAEKAYDGGLMKKAFGGLTNDPMADEKGYMNEDGMTREAIKEQMINANRMPSVRK